MPDYKKKKVHKKLSSKRKNSPYNLNKRKSDINGSNKENYDIKMSPLDNSDDLASSSRDSIKVIKGKKLERRRRFRIFLSLIATVLLVYIILSFTLPVSVGENLGNFAATIGAGEYPAEIYGTETLDTASKKLYYYVLTDTNLSAFSSSGKDILSISHGYSKPILKTSETRALIFDQGGNSLKIYNLKKKITEYTPKKPIITADIARNGSYAVALYSDSYASTVNVFSKSGKLFFEWNSAKDTVNAVTLSPDARYLAVSVFGASGGNLVSKVSVFDTNNKSADPVFSYDISDGMVYSLTSGKKGFTVATSDGVSFITWSDFSKTEKKSDRQLSCLRSSSQGIVAVFNLNSNKSDNIISVISPKGESISEFKFNGLISDIRFSNGHIYCISEAKAYLYDKTGKLLCTSDCGFDAFKIAVTGSTSIAAISDSQIQKIKFEM